jgi:hypothetical protein
MSLLLGGIRVSWPVRRLRREHTRQDADYSTELSRPIDRQTKVFGKSDPTPSELQEFEWAGERIRQLFAELEQLNKAA